MSSDALILASASSEIDPRSLFLLSDSSVTFVHGDSTGGLAHFMVGSLGESILILGIIFE